MSPELDHLWQDVAAQFRLPGSSMHGPRHWRRVERNGVVLARHSGADLTVVRLFAIYHDSQRTNEFRDPGHGARGAAYVAAVRAMLPDLSDERFALLQRACEGHTNERHSTDCTIGTCWDADRLDLARVGIIPKTKFMSTAVARHITTHASKAELVSLARTDAADVVEELIARPVPSERTPETSPGTPFLITRALRARWFVDLARRLSGTSQPDTATPSEVRNPEERQR